MSWAGREGLPYPLGASRSEDGSFNFVRSSKYATEVTLMLFDDVDRVPRGVLARGGVRRR